MPTRLLHALLLLAVLIPALVPVQASAPDCPRAPRPRLRVGEPAVVAPGIERLRLRSLPAVSTGVVGEVRAGRALSVLAGPSCNGPYAWWRVETDGGTRGWVAEGDWSTYYVVPARDAGRDVDPFAWTCLPRNPTRICDWP